MYEKTREVRIHGKNEKKRVAYGNASKINTNNKITGRITHTERNKKYQKKRDRMKGMIEKRKASEIERERVDDAKEGARNKYKLHSHTHTHFLSSTYIN